MSCRYWDVLGDTYRDPSEVELFHAHKPAALDN